jgi:hypothetical protein
MAQDGRQQANAQELAQLRSVTQIDLGLINQDANSAAPPTG